MLCIRLRQRPHGHLLLPLPLLRLEFKYACGLLLLPVHGIQGSPLVFSPRVKEPHSVRARALPPPMLHHAPPHPPLDLGYPAHQSFRPLPRDIPRNSSLPSLPPRSHFLRSGHVAHPGGDSSIQPSWLSSAVVHPGDNAICMGTITDTLSSPSYRPRALATRLTFRLPFHHPLLASFLGTVGSIAWLPDKKSGCDFPSRPWPEQFSHRRGPLASSTLRSWSPPQAQVVLGAFLLPLRSYLPTSFLSRSPHTAPYSPLAAFSFFLHLISSHRLPGLNTNPPPAVPTRPHSTRLPGPAPPTHPRTAPQIPQQTAEWVGVPSGYAKSPSGESEPEAARRG
ncbi:hypothetical protein B0H13DRAFT_2662237 [Mycena leptocephala]|nr:hypothetical protein B0H13DRAFT_2662237 [Mycena leptocephala]